MRTYYLHAATINRFGDEIIERCLERATPYRLLGRFNRRDIRPGVTIAFEVLSLGGAEWLEEDPTNLIQIFADAFSRKNIEARSPVKIGLVNWMTVASARGRWMTE